MNTLPELYLQRKGWPFKKAKFILTLLRRPVGDGDEVVTAFRDGQVTARSNRRDDGFTFALKEIGYQGVRRGDLVVHGMDAFAGAVGVSESDGKCSPVYSVLRGTSGCDARFYAYLLRDLATNGYVASLSRGIRERSTDFRYATLKELELPLPRSGEQRAIADFLDRKTAAIDGLIAKKERLIELLEEKRQALITQAVTKGLDPNVPMKDSGIDWLGPIPAHWRLSTLGREGCFMPGTGFPHEYQGLVGEELPFFKVGDMAVAENSIELKVAAHSISRETARVLKARICPAGSIAFAKVGAALLLNRRRLTVDDCIFDNNMMAYGPYDQEPRFAWLWMQLIDLSKIAQPGPVPSITATAVGQMPYALPPRAEQEVIAAFARSVQERHANVKRALQESIERLREYRQALITAAVTGKIDVTREEAAEIPDSDG